MVQLYRADGGRPIGSITEEQLQFLIDALEEESSTDKDYYLTGATIDMLEDDGAEPELVALLREALGGRESIEIRWSRD